MKSSTIAKAREGLGMSQEQAAVGFGISTPTWRRYERDPEVMTLATAHRMADFLRIEFEVLAPSRRG